ncbi:MAG: hypothetical protein AAB263_21450 [Planctomycetota bacterium]
MKSNRVIGVFIAGCCAVVFVWFCICYDTMVFGLEELTDGKSGAPLLGESRRDFIAQCDRFSDVPIAERDNIQLGIIQLRHGIALVHLRKWALHLCGGHSMPAWIVNAKGKIIAEDGADLVEVSSSMVLPVVQVRTVYLSAIPMETIFKISDGVVLEKKSNY